MSQLGRVRRIYDQEPAAYHRGMSVVTERLLRGRPWKVGEIASGRLLDIGFGEQLNVKGFDAPD